MYDLLNNVRIVDMTSVVLGPYATQLLADMGADVVKVEAPGGDVFRSARPGRSGGDGAGFLNINRNKRSVVLDAACAEDREILNRLIGTADVFVHNIRPRSAARLRIDYDRVRAYNEAIIYCSARGFGAGPLGDEPAYDDCIQAASGLAWLNAGEDGKPNFVPSIVCDKIAGLHLAFAIAAALASRLASGKGCFIETPMYEAMVSFLMVEQMGGQAFDPPLPERGYPRLRSPGRRPHATRDGFIAVMPYTAAQWSRYLRLVGRHDLAHAKIVTDPDQRGRNIDRLYDIIAEASPARSTAEWLEILRRADIPCAPVNRIEDLLDEPHLARSGIFETLVHPREGRLVSSRSPFNVATAERRPDRPAPVLDADRAGLLAELGDLAIRIDEDIGHGRFAPWLSD